MPLVADPVKTSDLNEDLQDAMNVVSKPCCDDPDSPAEDDPSRPAIARAIESSFYNAMELCFAELSIEPKRILLVGGCRQRDFARRLGFLLPFCKIVALDPDKAVVEAAEKEVACRFRFEHEPLSKLPYNDDGFDFTIVHNLAEFTEHPKRAVDEIARVTKHHVLMSHHRPFAWFLMKGLASTKAAMKQLGCTIPERDTTNEWEQALYAVAETQLKVAPLPWVMHMAKVKPNPPKKTALT
jgi:SAM-dependent methyltransferase